MYSSSESSGGGAVIYGPTSQIQSIVNLLRHTSTIPPNAHSGANYENFIKHTLMHVMETGFFERKVNTPIVFYVRNTCKKINFY